MGQKLPLCGQLGAARSRQDETKEVGEAGSKRTSSGGNGGHPGWWSGLIFRLLKNARCPGLPGRPRKAWPGWLTELAPLFPGGGGGGSKPLLFTTHNALSNLAARRKP
jgi:hypothetical protein